jgi:hypothetical protein
VLPGRTDRGWLEAGGIGGGGYKLQIVAAERRFRNGSPRVDTELKAKQLKVV